ncbi:MAG: proline racemase family protein [Hyphomicrobiaceae bacterium]
MSITFERSVQVIDSHTAGHPTRVILGGLPKLEGDSVKAQRDDFRENHDALRPALLHEPRGHAAMVGAVVVPSRVADVGAFFISSYVYLDMCGHGTIGLAKTLAAIGEIEVPKTGERCFTLETPAGVVGVAVETRDGQVVAIRIDNVDCHVLERSLTVEVDGLGQVDAATAYGGGVFAIVDAKALGLEIAPDNVSELCRIGARIKAGLNSRPGLATAHKVGSVLLHQDLGERHARHLVVLERNKFDRSPCGTGTSARLAVLHAAGRLGVGEDFRAEGVLGTEFLCRIERVGETGGAGFVSPSIRGLAHITAFSTLVIEASDPLAAGFLCR